MKNFEHIVVFSAHPDDEGSVWATLYKYYESGAKITIIWMTYGDKFIATIGKYVNYLIPLIKSIFKKKQRIELSNRIKIIRKKEAQDAARMINAKSYFLGFKDAKVPDIKNKEAILKITNFIRKLKPTIILTHWFLEMHKDHRNTSALIYESFHLSNDPKYSTDYPPSKVRLLGFWDERGWTYKPNYYINVSNQIERIKEWEKNYKSQAFRILGRLAKFKSKIKGKNTPYNFIEAYKIIGLKIRQKYGDFFL